jgi:hypothetical protein
VLRYTCLIVNSYGDTDEGFYHHTCYFYSCLCHWIL